MSSNFERKYPAEAGLRDAAAGDVRRVLDPKNDVLSLASILRVAALVAVGLIALLIALVALGAFIPGLGLVSELSTVVVPAAAPTLVVAGAVVTAAALLLRRRLPVPGTVVGIIGAAGTIGMVVAVAVIMAATSSAGGSINPFRAVFPGSLTAATPDAHVVYTTTKDGQQLHAAIYRPKGVSSNAPVYIYVHGGGWVTGSELDLSTDMRWFADHGYLVVSLEYTLSTPTHHTWDIDAPQIGCGIQWAIQHAAQWGGDPARYVLVGDSAGGQLSVSVGYAAAAGKAVSSCGGHVPAPTAVAVSYPPVDLPSAYAHGFHLGADHAINAQYIARAYTGGSPGEFPERYHVLSGYTAINSAAPPTLVISPSRDDLVPPGGVRKWAGTAKAAGIKVDLVEMPLSNHAYDGLAADSIGNQARRSIMLAWLDKTLPVPKG